MSMDAVSLGVAVERIFHSTLDAYGLAKKLLNSWNK
jgi:hypothetical protein